MYKYIINEPDRQKIAVVGVHERRVPGMELQGPRLISPGLDEEGYMYLASLHLYARLEVTCTMEDL
jgi:hypothetical protein